MPLMHQFVEHLKERDFRTVAIYLLDAQFMGEAPADVSPRLDTGIHTHTHTHTHTQSATARATAESFLLKPNASFSSKTRVALS